MKTDKRYVIAFDSTHHAIKAEKILKAEDLNIRVIPTPREISASCGLSIKFNEEDLNKIIEVFSVKIKENIIIIKGIFSIEKNLESVVVNKIME